MISFRYIIPDSVKKPIDMLTHLVETKSVDDFPNYCVDLRIPVTVASGETSMLSIENDINGQSLNYDDVIDSFAATRSRKVVL